jgi:hypothetical protein
MELGDVLQGGSGIQFLLDKDSSLLRSQAPKNLESCSADAKGANMDERRFIPVVTGYARVTAAMIRTVGSTLTVLNIQNSLIGLQIKAGVLARPYDYSFVHAVLSVTAHVAARMQLHTDHLTRCMPHIHVHILKFAFEFMHFS